MQSSKESIDVVRERSWFIEKKGKKNRL